MKKVFKTIACAAIALASSCIMSVNNPTNPGSHSGNGTTTTPPERFSCATIGFFPFEDNTNRWYYTEGGGNNLSILVTDTISDDGIVYYRVSFRENHVDTTDDWFKRTASGILFGESLAGTYSLFLPAKIDSVAGRIRSAGSMGEFTYYESLSVNGTTFRKALILRYDIPLLHGFDQITFADSVGIVELQDHSGRWPVIYHIDSCSLFGTTKKF
jgi:hypothetical protein